MHGIGTSVELWCGFIERKTWGVGGLGWHKAKPTALTIERVIEPLHTQHGGGAETVER